MAKPNFIQLKKINDYLKQVDELNLQIKSLEEDLQKTKKYYDNQEEEEKQKLTTEIKQRMLLDRIEEDLKDLREVESDIRSQIEKIINEAISDYFGKGNFKEFVAELVSVLEKKKMDFKVKTNKHYATYLPTNLKYEEVKESETLRIDLGFKTYILDIDEVKRSLKTKLLQAKAKEVYAD